MSYIYHVQIHITRAIVQKPIHIHYIHIHKLDIFEEVHDIKIHRNIASMKKELFKIKMYKMHHILTGMYPMYPISITGKNLKNILMHVHLISVKFFKFSSQFITLNSHESSHNLKVCAFINN